MRRVLIIGSGGAGKSTFARQLGERTGLPVVHLDQHYWSAGWTPTPKDEWVRTVEHLTEPDAWIMDGNYSGTMDARLHAADSVIFLDLPRLVCLRRVITRWLRYRGRTRPDIGAGCREQLSWEFIEWIWTYPHRRRPGVLQKLRALESEKRVIVLESTRAVARFLADVKRQSPASPLA